MQFAVQRTNSATGKASHIQGSSTRIAIECASMCPFGNLKFRTNFHHGQNQKSLRQKGSKNSFINVHYPEISWDKFGNRNSKGAFPTCNLPCSARIPPRANQKWGYSEDMGMKSAMISRMNPNHDLKNAWRKTDLAIAGSRSIITFKILCTVFWWLLRILVG